MIECKKCHIVKDETEFLKKSGQPYNRLWCADCRREYDRLRYKADPSQKKALASKWAAENKVRHSELTLAWAKANPDKHRDACNKWERKNPERARLKNYKRRMATSSRGEITAQEWDDLKKQYDYTCLCCYKREPEVKLTIDHVIPLHLGGDNVVTNAQPLCKRCNSSKGIKTTDYRVDKQLGMEQIAA